MFGLCGVFFPFTKNEIASWQYHELSHEWANFPSSLNIWACTHLPVCVSNFKTFSNPSSPPQAMNPWSLFQDTHFSFTLLGMAIWKATTATLNTSRSSWEENTPQMKNRQPRRSMSYYENGHSPADLKRRAQGPTIWERKKCTQQKGSDCRGINPTGVSPDGFLKWGGEHGAMDPYYQSTLSFHTPFCYYFSLAWRSVMVQRI